MKNINFVLDILSYHCHASIWIFLLFINSDQDYFSVSEADSLKKINKLKWSDYYFQSLDGFISNQGINKN